MDDATSISGLHKRSGKPSGRVMKLNSTSDVLIGVLSALFGEHNERGRRAGHRYVGNSTCRRDVGFWGIVYREQSQAASDHPSRANGFGSMTIEYRQIEYALVQGIGQHTWKWSASVAGVVITGPRAHQSGRNRRSREGYRSGTCCEKGATCSAPTLRLKAQIKSAAATQAITAIDRFRTPCVAGGPF